MIIMIISSLKKCISQFATSEADLTLQYFTQLFNKHYISMHRMPISIVLERDQQFTSVFW
jgi:hypothetical protein